MNFPGALPTFQALEACRLASTSSGVERGVRFDPEAEEGNLVLVLVLDICLGVGKDCFPN